MSGRNWVLRRMLIDAIKADPAWNNGNYTQEPPTFKYVATFFSFATAGGTQSFFRRAPTRMCSVAFFMTGPTTNASRSCSACDGR